jgi:putative colanic acid biosynthesis acetyltransferase WcaF
MEILDATVTRPLEGGPTYSLRNRAFRGLWSLCWLLLASWTPPPLNGWRLFLLRIFGAKVTPQSFIYGSARIWYPPRLELGKHSRVAPFVTLYCVEKIIIHDYATVSQGTHLCTAGHDLEDVNFQTIARTIIVGRRAWVAAECFIGPGVTIGEGAVLGARGCAFRDLEPWTVYAGNPARAIKKRKIRFPAFLDQTQ